MSYIKGLGAFSKEQEEALFDITPKEIRTLPLDRKLELAYQHLDTEARKKEAFWTAVEGFATGMIPLLAFLGITKLTK